MIGTLRLQAILWLSHASLAAAVAAAVVTSSAAVTAKAMLVVAALLPLLAAVPGLRARRRYTYQWLTVAMVWYIGIAVVEVLASASRANLASLALAAALVELALLLALIRRTPSPARCERTES